MDTTWDESHPHLKRMHKATEDEDGSTKLAIGRIGNRPQLTVVFQQRDGSGRGFSYAHLYSVEYAGQDELVAEFSEHRVAVRGRNLGKLLRYLCDHKACQVWETDRAEFAEEKAEVVESIVVTKKPG